MYAAARGLTEMTKFLVDNGASVNATTTLPKIQSGETALFKVSLRGAGADGQAARQGHIDVIKILKSSGADIKALNCVRAPPVTLTSAVSAHCSGRCAERVRPCGDCWMSARQNCFQVVI
jgi:hypothetical protein